MDDVLPGPRPEQGDAYLLYERYRGPRARSRALAAYYAVKPVLPRRLQIVARRVAARRQRRMSFPQWPAEPALLRRRAEALRGRLSGNGDTALPIVNLWPGRERFAVALTHDVEGPAGMAGIPALLEVERRHGFVSSWNFCGDWYRVEARDLDAIRQAGCEVGLHGIKHDGRLFESRETFDRNLPLIREAMTAWGAVGFRSPAMGRNADWMHELPCRYDSSFPDTDPFQPQPGGCCSIHPFFFGDVVELPVTLTQDFMLFELLRARDIRLWTDKSAWIMRHHGLVNVIVHPDYMTPERLDHYDRFLAFLADAGGWHALPREIAGWWRTRAGLRVVRSEDGEARIEGDGAERAAVAWARSQNQEIVYEL
jgi:hypothetical protein